MRKLRSGTTSLEEVLRVTTNEMGVRSLIEHKIDPATTALADTDL